MENQQTIINYRISRAEESLEEAIILAQNKHWNACVNRLYYACFYAVNALLLSKQIFSSKHSGVRSLFNRHFVKTSIISIQNAYIYNDLFERRQESDYEDLFTFNAKDVEPWIDQARQFISSINQLLSSR